MSRTPTARRLALAASAAALAMLAGCDDPPAEVGVAIDGGSGQVALLGDVVVAARPGATVTVRHATEPVAGHEAPMTHALVAADETTLPPIFHRGAGGIVPNPAVWGPCRGGDPAAAVGQCPVPAAEGPQAWDGRSFWSLGAQLPGEKRQLPLSRQIAAGDHVLVCALHPQLRLIVRVDATDATDATAPPRSDAGTVDAALQSATRRPVGGQGLVRAGTTVAAPPAYVAAFSPDPVLLRVGDSLTWRAGGRAPVDVVFGAEPDHLSLSHTTPEDGLPAGEPDAWDGRGELRSGFLSADPSAGASAAEWTVTFARAGTFAYASRFSDSMTGTVVVEEDTDG